MPEYLAPGVYVEEVSFRSKSIEGVPTSTTGFAGLTRWGPVQYTDGPRTSEPRLIVNFTEFERVYGGLEPLQIGSPPQARTAFTAHAARAYFENGGRRLWVSRVFVPLPGAAPGSVDPGVASRPLLFNGSTATWRARWPGLFGNVDVSVRVVRTKNVIFQDPVFGFQARRAKAGAVVEVYRAAEIAGGTTPADGNDDLDLNRLAVVEVDAAGQQSFRFQAGVQALAAGDVVQIVEMQVRVRVDAEREDVYDELGADPQQKRYIGRILERDDPEDENAVVWFDWDPTASPDPVPAFLPAHLMEALQGNTNTRLIGGNDGGPPLPTDFAGSPADLDNADIKATGLEALGEIEEIAIVALPDGGALPTVDESAAAAGALIAHAERLRYRIAVIDAPEGSSMNEIREFRGRFDSKYAAIYHPWIQVFDPTERPAQGAPPRRLLLPPSGFVTGIYARSDIERGVHKAPANEVVRGLTRFEANINKERQDVLNPVGINALRFFENRGSRVWGARTISSDPEWKYVNVRRLFIYIEHSIDRGTQYAVFEPNGPQLWANVRQSVEDFLLVLWRDGALLGDTPEQAFFVRCDRTTMTQNDLDNGRLICLIGVAPVKPAEFVIFRIGQFTADARL
jgi:phage tail sheath protein FI